MEKINFVTDATLGAAGCISYFVNQAYDLHIAAGGQPGINFIQFNTPLVINNLQDAAGTFFRGTVMYNPVTNSGFE